MLTEAAPRDERLKREFLESDRLITLLLPSKRRMRKLGSAIGLAMGDGRGPAVQEACSEFLSAVSEFYGVDKPGVRVLAARPLRVYDNGGTVELFGDYTPKTLIIRLWMRTAVQKRVTSFGTFLSTLCHEFAHHLDCQRLGFSDTPHTRGFYERTALLYHHARGTPLKPLHWVPYNKNRWRIDWTKMPRG